MTDVREWKFNKLKEHLELSKEAGDKELELYIRKIMTEKYVIHMKHKIKRSENLVRTGPENINNNNNNTSRIINNQPTPLPLIPNNPGLIPYSKTKDKYSNNLVSCIGMRNRMDSNCAILESIKNNNKTGFIKPYV